MSLIQSQIHKGHKITAQAKRNMCIIVINVEEPITYQGAFYKPNRHQTPCGKSKVNISLCISNSYQITDLEDIHSKFDQVRPVVSHLEVSLTNKPPTPKNIGEGSKVLQR